MTKKRVPSAATPLFSVFGRKSLASLSVASLLLLIALVVFGLYDPNRFEIAFRVGFFRGLVEFVVGITSGTFLFILFPFIMKLPVWIATGGKAKTAPGDEAGEADAAMEPEPASPAVTLVGPAALSIILFLFIDNKLPAIPSGPREEAQVHGLRADFYLEQANTERIKNPLDIEGYRRGIRNVLDQWIMAQTSNKLDPMWPIRIAGAQNELGEYASAEGQLLGILEGQAKLEDEEVRRAIVELIAAQRLQGKDAEAKEWEAKGRKIASNLGDLVQTKIYKYQKNDDLSTQRIQSARDLAREAIETYYQLISAGKFQKAYDMIHPARIAKIDELRKEAGKPPFTVEDFKKTYRTSREYTNFSAQWLENEKGVGGSRVYRVVFDVKDEVPVNRLYESRKLTIRSVMASDGHLEFDQIKLLQNVREYFLLPSELEGKIWEHIKGRQLGSLFDPMFVSELGRDFDLAIQPDSPSYNAVHRHFRQKLHLLPDGGGWKIRDGLAIPEALAVYGDAPPR